MSQTIFINEVKNTGHQDLSISLQEPTGNSVTVILPPGSSSNLINLDLSAVSQTKPLQVTVGLANDYGITRSVNLYYEEMASGNQFFYCVLIQGQSTAYQPVKSPTRTDSNISLALAYEGDGVVVVGTSDF